MHWSRHRKGFYNEASGCELNMILKDVKTLEVKEMAECSVLISTLEEIYERVGGGI